MAGKLNYMEERSIHSRSKRCRLCEDTGIVLRFGLVPTPPAEWYYPEARKHLTEQTFPLDVYQCLACGHVQLIDIIDPKALYDTYFYTTASSPGLTEYFKKYALHLISFLELDSSSLVVDIGSNDGTFLHNFLEMGYDVIGVEPSKIVAEVALKKDITTINDFLNENVVEGVINDFGRASLITANNVFAHNDDLSNMARCIRKLLKPDGIFVFEVSNLYDTIFKKVFDFIYHEHLSYHSVKPLKKFINSHGMNLFHVEKSTSKGGTIRCYCKTDISYERKFDSVEDYIKMEEDAGLYNSVTYSNFSNEIKKIGTEFKNKLLNLKKDNKIVVGYGACATVTTLIYQFDIANLIDFLVDDNPIRHFTYSPGHHIPVYPPSYIDERKVDSIAILAWRFETQILERNRQRFDNKTVIIPNLHHDKAGALK
jgi:SAM-dependent methyltransferase|tara:strand:+ start:4035 stop:5312 length:1278 start_codon:yes stop_codon:yes gene_type:complete